MKKYGVYVLHSGSKDGVWLMREYSELKDAVREAFRLARCRYHHIAEQLADIFIVGDNTGIVFDPNNGIEYITYCVDCFTVADNVVRRIIMIGDQNRLKSSCPVKVGIIDEKIYDISEE